MLERLVTVLAILPPGVPMRDGTRLAADLYGPSVDCPVAAVVDRTGAGRAVSPAHWTRSAEYFAAHGLAVAI